MFDLSSLILGIVLGGLLVYLVDKRGLILMATIKVPADAELKLQFGGEVTDSKGNVIENAEVVITSVTVENPVGNWGTLFEDPNVPGEWDLRFQEAGGTADIVAVGTVNGINAAGRITLEVEAGAPALAAIDMSLVVDDTP